MSNELAKRNATGVSNFNPQNMDDLWKLCINIAKSGLAPAGVKGPQDAMVIIMYGSELGLGPMKSLQNIHVIKGKPSMSADLQVAMVRASDECEYFKWVEWTDKKCTYVTKRKGEHYDEVSFTFTLEDANRAGLGGGMYNKYPKHMLRARAASTLARAEYPEIMAGIYMPEELEAVEVRESSNPNNATGSLNDKFAPKKEEVIEAEFEPDEPTVAERTEKMIGAFEAQGVTKEQLEQHAGKPVDEFDEGDLETMKDAYKYIRGDESMRDELFPPIVEEVEESGHGEAIVDEEGNELPDV